MEVGAAPAAAHADGRVRRRAHRAFFCNERAGCVLCHARRHGRACAALAAFDDSWAVIMTFRKKAQNPDTFLSSHAESIIKDARHELKNPARRLLGKRILTLGGIGMLSGCNLSNDKSVN